MTSVGMLAVAFGALAVAAGIKGMDVRELIRSVLTSSPAPARTLGRPGPTLYDVGGGQVSTTHPTGPYPTVPTGVRLYELADGSLSTTHPAGPYRLANGPVYRLPDGRLTTRPPTGPHVLVGVAIDGILKSGGA